MRWGIEANYNYLKNKLYLEDFQSLNLVALYQSFYATILNSNLISLAIEDVNIAIHKVDIILHKSNEAMYNHKANINYILGLLSIDFCKCLFVKSQKILYRLYSVFFSLAVKNKIPIRPNRHVQRIFKMKKVDKFFCNIRTNI